MRKIRIPMSLLEESHNPKRVEEDRSIAIEVNNAVLLVCCCFMFYLLVCLREIAFNDCNYFWVGSYFLFTYPVCTFSALFVASFCFIFFCLPFLTFRRRSCVS